MLAAGAGLTGLGATGILALLSCGTNRAANSGGMMGNVSDADMNIYVDMFNRHTELKRPSK